MAGEDLLHKAVDNLIERIGPLDFITATTIAGRILAISNTIDCSTALLELASSLGLPDISVEECSFPALPAYLTFNEEKRYGGVLLSRNDGSKKVPWVPAGLYRVVKKTGVYVLEARPTIKGVQQAIECYRIESFPYYPKLGIA